MKIKVGVVGRTKIDPDQQVTLDHVRLSGQDYSFRSLRKFCAIGSRLQQCRFNNARISHASFGSGREMSEYVECTFDGVHFDHGGGNARFVGCSFLDVYFREWLGQSSELIDCTFSGRINWAVFCGKIPLRISAETCAASATNFTGMIFRGRTWSTSILLGVLTSPGSGCHVDRSTYTWPTQQLRLRD